MQFSVIASAIVAAIVGFGGTLPLVVEASRHLAATPEQTSSWATALCLGIAVTSAGLSTWYRIPVLTAWSLAGSVLIASAPPGLGMGDAVGAFILSGVLMALSGAVPVLGAWIARLPAPVAAGMLAGLLLRFVLAPFQAAQTEPALVLPLLLLFLVARLLHAASAPLAVIAVAPVLAWALGYPLQAPHGGLPALTWIAPHFSWAAMAGLGVPLFLVTMATQQISGAAVLTSAGYVPPMRGILLSTGLVSVLASPFGGYSVNLSSITASICTGPEAHPDPAKRWLTGPVYGACYVLMALFGAWLAAALHGLPAVLITTVAGAALLGPLTGALASAMQREPQRLAACIAFGVTASGTTLAGVGAAFWGLLAGLLALGLAQTAARLRRA